MANEIKQKTAGELAELLRERKAASTNTGVSDLKKLLMEKKGIKPRPKLDTIEGLKAFYEEQTGKKVDDKKKESLFSRGVDLISRPLYASAGAAKAIGSGQMKVNPLMAAWKGLTGEEKTTYADVLEAEGLFGDNKLARGGVGFALDVAMDPTTYLGGPLIKGLGKGASKIGRLGIQGVEKFNPEIARGFVSGAETVKDAFGTAFVEGYKTSKKLDAAGVAVKELAIDTAKHFNNLGTGIDNIIKDYIGDYKNLPKAQHEQFAETLLNAKKEIVVLNKKVYDEAIDEWAKMFPDVKIKDRAQAIRILDTIEDSTVKQISSIRARIDGIIKKEYDASGNFIVSGEGGRLNTIDKLNEVVEGLKSELANTQKFKKAKLTSVDQNITPEEMSAVRSKLISYEEERLADIIADLTGKIERSGKKEMAERVDKAVATKQSVDELLAYSERKILKLQNDLADKSRILQKAVDSRKIAKKRLNEIVPEFATKEQKDFFDKYHKPRIDAMADAAGVAKEGRFDYYFPSIDTERLALKKTGAGTAFSVSDESYLKEYGARIQKELKEPIEAMSRQTAKIFRDGETRNFLKQAVDDYGINKVDYDMLTLAEKAEYAVVKEKGRFGKEIGYLKKVDYDYLDKKLYPEYTAVDMLAKATGFDAFTNTFKKAVTAFFPAFHVRNMLSGVVQNYQAIGSRALDPKVFTEGLSVLKGSEKTMLKYGKWEGTAADLKKLITERFGSSSQYISDYSGYIDELARGEIKFNKAMSKLNPRQLGNLIETNQKTQATIASLKNGMGIEQSLNAAEKAGFDYSRLTNFEAKIMRRAIPFYSFARKNAALQANTLAKHPERIISQVKLADAFSNMFGGDVTKEDVQGLPPWVLSGLGFKIEGDKYVSKFGLPLEEFIDRVNNPLMSTLTSLNPLVKYPLESKLGFDFFREKNIIDINQVAPATGKLLMDAKESGKLPEWFTDAIKINSYVSDFDGETKYTASPKALHLIRNIPTSRFQNTLESVFDKDMDKVNKWVAFFSGGRIYDINVDQQKFFDERDLTRDLQDELLGQGVGKRMEIFYQPKR